MNNLNFILQTTNCLNCKFFNDKCVHENSEEHEADFHEINGLYEEDSSSFVDDFKGNERKYFICLDFQYIHD